MSNHGGVFELNEFDEIRPTKGAPLTPGYVVRDRFAPVMRRHGGRMICMDAHYRMSAIEHLTPLGFRFVDAPAGAQGKYDAYFKLRAAVHSGRFRIPRHARLVAQMKETMIMPLPGGGVRISSPRRAGQGHGDILSAVVLGVWDCTDMAGIGANSQQVRPAVIRTGFGFGAQQSMAEKLSSMWEVRSTGPGPTSEAPQITSPRGPFGGWGAGW